MRIKTVFNALSKLFDWVWNINLVLGLAAILFVSVNAFTNKKAITASYLGNFKINTDQVGQIDSKFNSSHIFIDDIIGSPSVLIDSKMNIAFVYAYIIFILSIVLFYNFQLKHLFLTLNLNIDEGTPFGNRISKRFKTIARFSFVLCFFGVVLSILKISLIQEINFNGLSLIPVFDSKVLNLAWIGLASYIISNIFITGCELKQERDLTI